MTLQDLECFMIVAQTMSYTKAAEKLCISQPAITKHVHALEKEYNLPLFDRKNKRSLQLTEAGTLFYETLLKCDSIFSHAEAELRSMTKDAPLTINLPKGLLIPYEYVKIMHEFAMDILPVNLQVNYIDSNEFASHLEKGELVICEEESLPTGALFYSQPITKNRVEHCIIVSKDHPLILAKDTPLPQDIKGCPVFLSKSLSQTMLKKYVDYLTRLYGHIPQDIVYVDSPDNIAIMLLANRGITLNTDWAGIISSRKTLSIPTKMTTNYYIAWNPETAVNQYIKKFINVIQ